jgi:hypothetical protein
MQQEQRHGPQCPLEDCFAEEYQKKYIKKIKKTTRPPLPFGRLVCFSEVRTSVKRDLLFLSYLRYAQVSKET